MHGAHDEELGSRLFRRALKLIKRGASDLARRRTAGGSNEAIGSGEREIRAKAGHQRSEPFLMLHHPAVGFAGRVDIVEIQNGDAGR